MQRSIQSAAGNTDATPVDKRRSSRATVSMLNVRIGARRIGVWQHSAARPALARAKFGTTTATRNWQAISSRSAIVIPRAHSADDH